MLEIARDLVTFDSASDSLEKLSEEQRRIALKQTSFFIKLSDFLHRHEHEYLTLRQQELAKSLAPPKRLVELSYRSIPMDEGLSNFYKTPEIARLLFIRALRPVDIASIVGSLLIPQILNASGEDYRKQLTISQLYGTKTYVKQQDPYEWKIWSVNRLYAICFSWNIKTGVLSDFGYTPPNARMIGDIKFFPFIQPVTLADSLSLHLREYQWNLYDSMQVEENAYYVISNDLAIRLQDFFKENKQQYVRIRKQLLAEKELLIPIPVTYHSLYEGSDFKDIEEQLFNLNPIVMEPEDLTMNAYIFVNSSQHFDQANVSKKLRHNAIVGFQHRAAPGDMQNVWKVQAIGYAEIVEYNWNIATGEITAIKIWEK